MKLALYKYKHPAVLKGLPDALIRWWTSSKYSHAELIIDNLWYSSSAQDGGVRCKDITLDKARWDTFELDSTLDEQVALKWFDAHKGQKYDYAGVARFVLPFLPNMNNRWFCFEAVGAMLGIEDTDKLTGKSLEEFVSKNTRLDIQIQ